MYQGIKSKPTKIQKLLTNAISTSPIANLYFFIVMGIFYTAKGADPFNFVYSFLPMDDFPFILRMSLRFLSLISIIVHCVSAGQLVVILAYFSLLMPWLLVENVRLIHENYKKRTSISASYKTLRY